MPLDYAAQRGTTMPLRYWFELGVRLIGVWWVALGLDELVTYANTLIGFFTPSHTAINAYLTHGIATVLIGFFLVFFAMGIVNAVYPAVLVTPDEPAAASGGKRGHSGSVSTLTAEPHRRVW